MLGRDLPTTGNAQSSFIWKGGTRKNKKVKRLRCRYGKKNRMYCYEKVERERIKRLKD
jgi:hypothetical protein